MMKNERKMQGEGRNAGETIQDISEAVDTRVAEKRNQHPRSY